jgi:hypothetical protein
MVVAGLHAVVHLATGGDLTPHAQAGMAMLEPRFVLPLPGLRQATYAGAIEALSITVALLYATIGLAGLALVRRRDFTPRLIRGVAGAYALGTGLALVASVALAFGLQTFVLALVPICFGLAAVPEE